MHSDFGHSSTNKGSGLDQNCKNIAMAANEPN